MEFGIMIRKLCVFEHLVSLTSKSLAKEIFQTQNTMSFPGLAKEATAFIKKLSLPNILDPHVNKKWSKLAWKKIVKNKVWELCEKELKEKLKEFEKLIDSKMYDEKFVTKEYLKNMSVKNARVKFKLRTKMTDVKFNYKNNPVNRATLWYCDSCQSAVETQSHILWCPAYSELRQGKDINNDEHLIDYVRKVLEIRDNLKITK